MLYYISQNWSLSYDNIFKLKPHTVHDLKLRDLFLGYHVEHIATADVLFSFFFAAAAALVTLM